MEPPPSLLPPPGLGLDVEQVKPPTMLANPGPWDKADSDTQRILKIDTFDGARFELHKGHGPLFATSHTVYMGSSMHQGGSFYMFGSTLLFRDTLLVGRLDNSMRLDAQAHGSLSNRLSHRIQASLAHNSVRESHLVTDFEYKGNDFTAGVKVGLTDGPLVGVSYFQAITPRLAVGGEGYYIDARRATHVTARARYTDNAVTACATASTNGTVSATLSRRINNRVGFAAEIELLPSTLQSHMSVGVEAQMRQAKFMANVTGTGLIQSTLSSTIFPNCSLLLSAIVQHSKDIYRFGAGIQLG